MTRGLRDYFSDDVGECLIDQPEAFQKAQEYMQRFMPPDAQRKLKLYQDPVPLFTRYQIESQIESAYSHKVTLPSGGSLVIDHTEALVSIDINSARSTRGGDIEATARNTNLEAAEEIARQLRLRDIGGLIVIDFIDMESQANQRAVEDMLRDAVKMDRARIQLGPIVALRIARIVAPAPAARVERDDAHQLPALQRHGHDTRRRVDVARLLRLIGEEARKERTGRVIAQVPVDVATYLMNEKRDWLNQIESRDKVSLVIVPNPHMQTPAYTLRRIRDDEKELPENTTVSYQIGRSAHRRRLEYRQSRQETAGRRAPGAEHIAGLGSAHHSHAGSRTRRRPRRAAPQVGRVGALLALAVRQRRRSRGQGSRRASSSTHAHRDRPAHRDARHDRYRTGGGGDRDRGT